MIINYMIILGILIILILGIFLAYGRRSRAMRDYDRNLEHIPKRLSEEALIDHVKTVIHEQTSGSLLDKGYTGEEYLKQQAIRSKLKVALRSCKHGHLQDKQIVKDHIFDILRDYIGDDVDKVLPFSRPDLMNSQDKFEILLYVYKTVKGYGYNALEYLIKGDQDHEGLAGEKQLIEERQTVSYIVTGQEIEALLEEEMGEVFALSHRDKLQIITQRIYQQFKGLGVVDEIRDMVIDGVSGGVSGDMGSAYMKRSVEDYIHNVNHVAKFYDSVWIMLSGKSIHLSFLSFGSEEELKRVCQNIYSYNKAGQLSENVGYKINEMKDGSRVVVVRPPFSESWAFFVRKFNLSDKSLEDIIPDLDMIEMITYLVKGARVIALTGAQGSGKTTMLMALVKAIYATLTLRVQETAFELHLRNIYPNRNILTFKETDTITGQEGLDVQKKTDGSVNILGEVATDPVASWMIQMAQVASLFTIFTHHAKTASDLVLSLRNSMLRTKTFSSEKIAEEQVASVLDYNIHLVRANDGRRYIERITEINVAESKDYPMDFMNAESRLEAQKAFMATQTEYFRRVTDRKTFEARDIVRFEEGRFRFIDRPSHRNIQAMKAHMTGKDQAAFDSFVRRIWGEAI